MIVGISTKLSQVHLSGIATFICCLIVASIMPAYAYYLPPFMILWGIAWLAENNFTLKIESFRHNKAVFLLVLFISFYLWQVSGLFISDSLSSGAERIVKRLSFLMFPLVLYSPSEKIIKNTSLILKVFAITGFLYLLWCLGTALNNSLTFAEGGIIFNPHPVDCEYENYFFSSRLTTLRIHPTYISVYYVLGIIIAFEAFIAAKRNLFIKALWAVIAFFLIGGIYLLSSRTAFIALILVLPVYLFFILRKMLGRSVLYIAVIFVCVALGGIILSNDRFSYDFNKIRSDTLATALDQDIRITIWKSAAEVIEDNPLLGVGTGDASSELKESFTALGYSQGYYEDLNAHNQFLEIQLENGLIGLIIFLGLIGYMIYIAVSDKNLVYGLFTLIIIIFFLFETALNRLPGITFFTYFSFLLIHLKRHPSLPEN